MHRRPEADMLPINTEIERTLQNLRRITSAESRNMANQRERLQAIPEEEVERSLHGLTLRWFHKLPRSSINTFNELWGAFISQHLCSVRQKRNISSLQTILKHEDESIRDFTRRFRQAVQ